MLGFVDDGDFDVLVLEVEEVLRFLDSAAGVEEEVFDGGFGGATAVHGVADGAFVGGLGDLPAHFEGEFSSSLGGGETFLAVVFLHSRISKWL